MNTLNKDCTQIISLLETHYKDIPQILAIPAKGGAPKVIKIDEVEKRNSENCNIYFTVNKVKDGVNKKPTKEDIEKALYVHLDLDPVVEGKYSPELRSKLLNLGKDVDCTFAIDTGNGIALYWRLNGDYSAEEVEEVNKAMIDKYSSYGADKGTHNIDRIMRVPFTTNYPTETKLKKGYSEIPTVSSVLQSTNKTYSPDEIIHGKVNVAEIELIDSDDMSSIDFAFFKEYIKLKEKKPTVAEMRAALKAKGMYEKRKELSNAPEKYERDSYIQNTINKASASLDELIGEFDDISDKSDCKTNVKSPLKKLLLGAMTKERREEIKNMNFLIDGVIPEGHHTLIFGPSGSGKTTVFHKIAKDICLNTDKNIIFLYLDGSPDIAAKMSEDIDTNALSERYSIITEYSASEVVNFFNEMKKEKESLSEYVFIIDTFKFISGDINNKNANKTALHLIKDLQKLGGTFISLAHTNKDGKKQSGTAEIEQDCDNLLRIDSEDLGNGLIKSSISKAGRARMNFKPCTYSFTAGDPASATRDEKFEPVDSETKALKDAEEEEARTLEHIIAFIEFDNLDNDEGKTKKKDAIEFINKLGYSARKSRELVDKYIGVKFKEVGEKGAVKYLEAV